MKNTLLTSGAILMAVAMAAVANAQVSTTAKDSYFEPKAESLEKVPANISIVRPTHFTEAPGKIKHIHVNDTLTRTVGRNVTFRDLIADAYDCDPGRVVLPEDAPKGGFDFLVTVSPKTRKQLRSAIETQLGYIATAETRDTEAMELRVKDANLPGLTVSTADDDDISYRDGKLYFTHQSVDLVLKGLRDGLGQPVVDKTGLTNYYDFSVTWSDKATQAMRDGEFSKDGVQKALDSWGLELKPATAHLEMFTVKKVH